MTHRVGQPGGSGMAAGPTNGVQFTPHRSETQSVPRPIPIRSRLNCTQALASRNAIAELQHAGS
jgi:hypothetical protein